MDATNTVVSFPPRLHVVPAEALPQEVPAYLTVDYNGLNFRTADLLAQLPAIQLA